MEGWLVRGPHGQVKAVADGSGVLTSVLDYHAWGGQAFPPVTGILPAYLDGDLRVVPERPEALPGMKAGRSRSCPRIFPCAIHLPR